MERNLVATGARAAVPDLKVVNQEGVFLIRNYADGVRINDSTITKSAHSCIIAGAGLIGLEMVEAFDLISCEAISTILLDVNVEYSYATAAIRPNITIENTFFLWKYPKHH